MSSVKYDLGIFGASAAGFAAAAVAARQGARVIVFRTDTEPFEGALASAVPNFIWRMLGLHQSGLRQSPAPAQIALAERAADEIFCRPDETSTATVFAEREIQAGAVYREFCSAYRRLRAGSASEILGTQPLLDFPPYATANEVLDDYFHDERIKTLLAAAALLRFGIAGDEAGSSAAFKTLADESWPSRTVEGPLLRDVLKAAAISRQVIYVESMVTSLRRNGRSFAITTANENLYTVKNAMAASADIARAIGLEPQSGNPALQNANGAVATVRIKLEEPPALDDSREHAAFFAVEDREHLSRARDAMMEGRLVDPPPFSFYIDGATLIARAPYCPSVFIEEGEIREWAGQDRQAFGRQIFEIAKKRLRAPLIAKSIDVGIDQRHAPDIGIDVPAPPRGLNEIRAAAELALELTREA